MLYYLRLNRLVIKGSQLLDEELKMPIASPNGLCILPNPHICKKGMLQNRRQKGCVYIIGAWLPMFWAIQ